MPPARGSSVVSEVRAHVVVCARVGHSRHFHYKRKSGLEFVSNYLGSGSPRLWRPWTSQDKTYARECLTL